MASTDEPTESSSPGGDGEGGAEIPIDEDGDITLPVNEILTGVGFASGKRGSGKSNAANVIAEELLERNYGFLIIDIDGEYFGLKEEYEILKVGADESCDYKVGPQHGEVLATMALEQNVPIILDVSGYLDREEADEVIYRMAYHLFQKAKQLRRPYLVIVEEAHEYIPESGSTNDAGDEIIRIAKRGRKHGLGLLGLTQRPASIDKNYVSQSDYILWFQFRWTNDINAVKAVYDDRPGIDKNEIGEWVTTLNIGESVLDAGWEEEPRRVQIRRQRTFDAGSTPDLEDYEPPELESISEDLVDRLQEATEQHEQRQDRIAALESELEDKEDRIQELQRELEQERKNTETVDKLADRLVAVTDSDDGSTGEALEEIREEKNREIQDLEQTIAELKEANEELDAKVLNYEEEIARLKEERVPVENVDELREAILRGAEALGLDLDGDDEQLRRRLREKDERIDELKSEIEQLRESGDKFDPEFKETLELLKHEAIQNEVQEAADDMMVSESHAWDILFYLADDDVDEATAEDLVPFVDLDTTRSVRDAVQKLQSYNLIKVRSGNHNTHHYSIDRSTLEEAIEQHHKRQEFDRIKDEAGV